jgi:ribonuclease HI
MLPQEFSPPNSNDTPHLLFPLKTGNRACPPVRPFIRRTSSRELWIYSDGACLDNGRANPRAGFSFVYRNSTQETRISGHFRLPLEKKGPTGELHRQTSSQQSCVLLLQPCELGTGSVKGSKV